MKYYFFFAFLIVHSFLALGQTQKRQISVLSVNFDMETIVSVKCEEFGNAFDNQLKAKTFFAEDSIEMLDKLLGEIKFAKQKINIDTRGKFMFINKQGNAIAICMDRFNISIEGKPIAENRKLREFLSSLIPKEDLYRHKR
jgi:hypothetical protein